MKQREVIFFIVLVGIVCLFIWRVLAARELKLHFGGFRHANAEERWYADFWFTNTSPNLIHCTGYVCEDSQGWRTNESLIDFQCTVGFQEKRVQEWPLWLASYLDLKPGEAVKIGLNITPGQVPKHIGLKYSSDPGPRYTNTVNTAWRKLKRHMPLRWLGKTPLYQTVLCPTELVFPEGEAAKTNGLNRMKSGQ
jgi:hypothetical protein